MSASQVGYDFWGNDREVDQASTVEECNRRCVQHEWCLAYAYDPPNLNCWLKTVGAAATFSKHSSATTGRCSTSNPKMCLTWRDASGYRFDAEIHAVEEGNAEHNKWVRLVRGIEAVDSPVRVDSALKIEFELQVENMQFGYNSLFDLGCLVSASTTTPIGPVVRGTQVT